MPRSVGAAAEAVVGSRGDAQMLKRVFDQSPVPMVMVDAQRRYVEVNLPARLAFRLSLEEMRGYAIEDLTPEYELPIMEAAWARLLETGCVAGPYEVVGPDGSHLDVVYYGLADALPGLHVVAFAPAGWPEDELGVLDGFSPGAGLPALTPREREVLQLAADGFSGPGIAHQLVVSPATVRTHFKNIYEKLDVSDRAAAVAEAMRRGILE